jgi:hypothetical protein
MKVTNLLNNPTNPENEISFNIESSGVNYPVWIKSSHSISAAEASGNALLCGTLIPAMKAKETINLPCHLDPLLISNAAVIQDIFQTWYPEQLDRVAIEALQPPKTSPLPENNKIGVFFSGGIDSFYTLLKNQQEISHIVYVHGFDIALHDTERREAMSQALTAIATELHVELVEVITNLREYSDRFCPWGSHYHGSALAMIGHLLSPTLKKIYISSDFTYNFLEPWGSHILVAPLWNTTNSNQIFYGMSTSRFNKSAFISENACVQKHLRVCWEHKNNNINCGECEKCIRSMTAFYSLGKLEAYSVFPKNYSLNDIRNIEIKGTVPAFFWKNILDSVKRSQGMHRLCREIESILNNYKTKEIISYANKNPNVVEAFVISKNLRELFFKKIADRYFPWLIKEIIKEIIKFILPFKRQK